MPHAKLHLGLSEKDSVSAQGDKGKDSGLFDYLCGIIADRCGKSIGDVVQDVAKGISLDAEAALSYGIVDRILAPTHVTGERTRDGRAGSSKKRVQRTVNRPNKALHRTRQKAARR